jgi:hypothetical protein
MSSNPEARRAGETGKEGGARTSRVRGRIEAKFGEQMNG